MSRAARPRTSAVLWLVLLLRHGGMRREEVPHACGGPPRRWYRVRHAMPCHAMPCNAMHSMPRRALNTCRVCVAQHATCQIQLVRPLRRRVSPEMAESSSRRVQSLDAQFSTHCATN